MKLSLRALLIPGSRNRRHEFLIGPWSSIPIVSGHSRVYYCIRCKWSFLVCENRIAALDGDGVALGGKESLKRFDTFADGPCPALAAPNAAGPNPGDIRAVLPRRNRYESRHFAPSHLSAWTMRARSLLRVSSGLRENLGERNDICHLHRSRTNLRLLSHRHDPS